MFNREKFAAGMEKLIVECGLFENENCTLENPSIAAEHICVSASYSRPEPITGPMGECYGTPVREAAGAMLEISFPITFTGMIKK